VLGEPFFGFLHGPAFGFVKKVTLHFHGVFADWFAYYGFYAVFFV
jgi:hypothetical protein